MTADRVRLFGRHLTGVVSPGRELTGLASIAPCAPVTMERSNRLGSRSRLETIQTLLTGPKETVELSARIDELHMLEDIGIVTPTYINCRGFCWTVVPGPLERIADCLN